MTSRPFSCVFGHKSNILKPFIILFSYSIKSQVKFSSFNLWIFVWMYYKLKQVLAQRLAHALHTSGYKAHHTDSAGTKNCLHVTNIMWMSVIWVQQYRGNRYNPVADSDNNKALFSEFLKDKNICQHPILGQKMSKFNVSPKTLIKHIKAWNSCFH